MAIQIGCDPEFLLMSGNSRVNVDFFKTTDHGEIGSDHGSRVGELRPKHGHPKDVAENIRNLILKLKTSVQNDRYRFASSNIKMIGGGGNVAGESIGGHIHLSGTGFCYQSFNEYKCKCKRGFSFEQTHEDRLILALDFFIGRRMKRVQGGKRGNNRYGQPADVRAQAWGFEYRTPPSWLSEPKLTESTLAIAYLIAKIWSVKPTAFDELLSQRKMARKIDYTKLIIETGDYDREYFTAQIENFRNIIFDKTYDMSTVNCFETWSASNATVAAIKTSIELMICQIKVIDNAHFESEVVAKICQFVTSEVKIYICEGAYAPHYMRQTKSSRLRTNTIYISKELRPFLKIKREVGIHVRFISFVSDTRTPITNAFMFTKRDMKTDLQKVVETILSDCVRKKIRREV
jgi:hypothetical protein